MASEYDQMIYRARVLASPTRLDVWCCIGDVGMFSTDIGRTLGLSAATVSYHLGLLEDAGLITRQRKGRNVLCVLTDVRWGVVSESEVLEMLRTTPTDGP
jgi:DNA-binding transcriptional ArsR family regulator